MPTHAWFTAFAPYEKPEVAVVVFVYGGGEGSEVAAPVAAEILRAYFNLPADVATIAPAAPPPPETRNAGATTPANSGAPAQPQNPANPPTTLSVYKGSVTQTQDSPNERPTVAGTVVDAAGQNVSGVNVVLENGNGQVVASVTTGTDGVFRFDEIALQGNARWFVRLTGTANSQGVAIELAPNKVYTLQFTGTPQ